MPSMPIRILAKRYTALCQLVQVNVDAPYNAYSINTPSSGTSGSSGSGSREVTKEKQYPLLEQVVKESYRN